MGNQYSKVAQALGNGAYFGYRGGKSVPYCGDMKGGYGGIKKEGAIGDNANGCYILASCMRGTKKDSTSDEGTFRDFEICFHTNKCIMPHHFVDISVRSLGTNVKRAADGSYMADNSGNVTHDKNGVAINIK